MRIGMWDFDDDIEEIEEDVVKEEDDSSSEWVIGDLSSTGTISTTAAD